MRKKSKKRFFDLLILCQGLKVIIAEYSAMSIQKSVNQNIKKVDVNHFIHYDF